MNDPRLFICLLHDHDYAYLDQKVECYIPRPLVGEVIQFTGDVGRVPYRAWLVRRIVHAIPRRGVDLHVFVEPVKELVL